VQCPRSVEGSRQQSEIRLGEFLSPPEQAHDNEEMSIGKKRSFDTAIEYDTVAIRATGRTRTRRPTGDPRYLLAQARLEDTGKLCGGFLLSQLHQISGRTTFHPKSPSMRLPLQV